MRQPEPQGQATSFMGWYMTVWTCMTCGEIGKAQSCGACGHEAMPGRWLDAESVERQLRNAWQQRDSGKILYEDALRYQQAAEDRLNPALHEIDRLKQKLGEADELLGSYGAGGSAAGTVPAIHNLAHRVEVAEARVAKLEDCAVEYCREWVYGKCNYCYAPAEFILWGKLLKAEALGPRCYDHAAKHVGHPGLSPGANYALFDLRPFLKAPS